MYEAMGYQILNNYIEVDLPKLDDTGDKNGD